MSVVEDLLWIYRGSEKAHGCLQIENTEGVKVVGKCYTAKGPATVKLWEQHLSGTKGIGIIPIRQDGVCNWGAIDVDAYSELNLEDLSMQLHEKLVLCRSKSGGAHIYLFLEPAAPAALVIRKLRQVAIAIGHPNAEIFPKQDKVDQNTIGNWINMPYFGENTTRYAIRKGLPLSLEEFITVAKENTIGLAELAAFQMDSINEPLESEEFADAPPCLRALVVKGFPAGSRNNALFSMGVYARRKFIQGWEDRVDEYNRRFMGPGTYTEVAAIIRSLSKKGYIYKCKDEPLRLACDREECAKAVYGLQPSGTEEKSKRENILDRVERPVVCYIPPKGSKDEPYWVFVIDGEEVDVTPDMIKSQAIFCREYLCQFHKLILPIKDNVWARSINELIDPENTIKKELAPDAGAEGQLWIHIEEFCTTKARAKSKDELIIGKPWWNEGRIYFRSGDLIKYLDQQRFKKFQEDELFRVLKRGGALHHHFTLRGKGIKCWSILTFDEQDEGFESVPFDAEPEKF